MLSENDFKQITLEDKSFFDAFHRSYPPGHSDYVFSTMVCWQHYMRYKYAQIGDSVVIMTERNGKKKFRPPKGPADREAVRQVFALARKSGTEPPISVVDSEMREWLSSTCGSLEFHEHRDFFDYVYLSRDLAELRGKRYLKIRNQLNYFERNYQYVTEPITPANMDEVMDFLRRWCVRRGCEEAPLLESEKIAVQNALNFFFELDLRGLAIRIDGKIEAFSVFEPMDEKMGIVHYEKANFDFKGIYQAINRETARILAGDFLYINREPDMGIAGLRTAKKKYHPHHMIKVYHIPRECI